MHSRGRSMLLGSNEDLDPGNSSMFGGMPTKAMFNKQPAKPFILDRRAFTCGKETDMRKKFAFRISNFLNFLFTTD
jgi:hypothetical protein